MAETLGQRMRAAAKKRRMGAYKIAGCLGIYPQTVYDWWKDEYRPEPHRLRAYVDAIGATMEELGEANVWIVTPAELEAKARHLVLAMLQGMAGGLAPYEAFQQATGEPLSLTPAQRAALDHGGTARLRQALNDLTGGDWAALPAEEQRRILDQLLTTPADHAAAGESSTSPPGGE